jgi:Fe-Mn family superoxide dismutase
MLTGDSQTTAQAAAKELQIDDVWEHEHYVDYRDARPKYVEAFWSLVSWEFAGRNLG